MVDAASVDAFGRVRIIGDVFRHDAKLAAVIVPARTDGFQVSLIQVLQKEDGSLFMMIQSLPAVLTRHLTTTKKLRLTTGSIM